MGLFEEFREPGWNTYYSDRRTPLALDVVTVITTYLAVVLAASIVLIVVGARGYERWRTFFRLIFCLHTGVLIVVCSVSSSWQVGHVHSHCEYSLEISDDIVADVSLYVGLKSINITLRGDNGAVGLRGSGNINYNEKFSFDRVQDIKSSYREALERGLPFPIVYSLQFFSVDGGGFVWQRAIRSAGHFTSIVFWTSFVSWFVANILLCFELVRGFFMMVLTGCLMVTGVVVYHTMQPTKPLVIRFEDGLLIPLYGWAFWLAFIAGIVACVAGAGLLVLHSRYPTTTARLFFVEETQTDDCTSGQLYDYSPGPLKIGTPFSRRLACRRSDKTSSTPGSTNNAFVLDDMRPASGSCSRSHVTDTDEDVAIVVCASDRHETDDDDDGESVASCRTSRAPADDVDSDRPSYSTTTRAVIERAASTSHLDDHQSATDVVRLSDECNVMLQQSPSSTQLTSEFTSTA